MAYLVSDLVELLSSIIPHENKQGGQIGLYVKKEVKNLITNLQAIKLDLVDAERRQWDEVLVKQWLGKFNKICYELDDVLEEWSTIILKSQNMGDEGPQRKVCSFSYSSCFSRNQGDWQLNIVSRIKDLEKRVGAIVDEKAQFNFNFKKSIEQLQDWATDRKSEMEELVNMLLSQTNHVPHVTSIVGLGGMGKTTLARIAFNDDRINSYFNKKLWVCVSDPFDEIKVGTEIFESLTGNKLNSNDFKDLLNNISQSIKGQKYLLVLDDVREEDPQKWKPLSNSLRHGLPGSKILVTTRNEKVALMMGLASDDYWSLFCELAFYGKSNIEQKNLESIGRKIVRKCKNMPIAVKLVGSLLRFKRTVEEWQSVLDSKAWEHKVGGVDYGPMFLSYSDLPSRMRYCFSYCSTFPKDYRFNKEKLIHFWMAQGYLKATQSKDMEMVGEEYIENLIARSLFQDVVEDLNDNNKSCKMNDMVHDFAQSIKKDEPVGVNIYCLETERMLLDKADEVKTLRSLSLDRSLDMRSEQIQKIIFSLTSLRSLNLENSLITEVANEVGNLIHLRYLSLPNNKELIELPEAICELFNLQILDLHGCRKLRKLPDGIGKLINLRCIDIEYTEVSFMPKGLDRLSSLRTVSFVMSGGNEVENAPTLEGLNQLRTLKIIGLEGIRNLDEVKKLKLIRHRHLTSMVLLFGNPTEGAKDGHEVMKAIEVPPNLQEMSIRNYTGISIPPNWITSFISLKILMLYECGKCEHLPPLGKLPSLESLEMHHMESVKQVGNEFLGLPTDGIAEGDAKRDYVIAFPRLKKLIFSNMPLWTNWEVGRKEGRSEIEEKNLTTTRFKVMPSLLILQISHCRSLKTLPNQILQSARLQELHIFECPLLHHQYNRENGEHWQHISHIPLIEIDHERLSKSNQVEKTHQTL